MMKIYDFETKAGIADKVTNSTVAHCICESKTLDKTIAKKYFRDEDEIEYHKEVLDKDLMLVHGILVSTNWNQNDDVFTPDETWKSKSTPRNKPANLEHMGSEGCENKIIGCITHSFCVDHDMNAYFPKGNNEPSMEDNFDIVVGIVVWEKYFPSAATMIKEKLPTNEISLSMECIFSDFGYALRRDEEIMLLDRNEITAWLTASLRIYGGEGVVDIDGKTYKIGRWLKNFTYSGVGFVENPANKRSIIFEDVISHASIRKISDIKFNTNSINSVLNSSKGSILWILK